MSMDTVSFCTDLFKGHGSKATLRDDKALGYYLDLLFKLDIDYLRDFPNTPRIYQSGVVYRTEDPGIPETWCTIPVVMRKGWGDCEDLACWLAAELVVFDHKKAWPGFSTKKFPGLILHHIKVRTSTGQVFDPSQVMGM